MTQSCAGCTAGRRATIQRTVGCAWLASAMALVLLGHAAVAEARRSVSDAAAAAGRVSADRIVLAARGLGDKPEPGSDRPSPAGRAGGDDDNGDNGNGAGPGDGPGDGDVDDGSGAAPGNQTPTVAARPISTASQCDRAPSIDGQGGGLASDEEAAVCYAVLALSRIGVDARTTYEALASQLYDSNPRYRKQAAEKIGQISGGLVDALPLLVEALGASDPRVKRTAAMIATDIREYARDVVPALERVARDQDKVVARAGVQSLVDLGPYVGKGLPTLAAALDHRDLGVRYFAGEGITRVDAQMRTTARALRRISGDHWDTSRVALHALEDDLRQHRASPFRGRAVATLAGIGPAGREQLDTLLASRPDVRTVDDLKDISRFTTDAVPPLVTALAEPDYPGSRSEVGDLDVAIGFGQLVQGLDADDENVRLASAQALQETSTSVARTLAALKDAPRADRFVRRAAGSVQNSIEASADDAVPALLAVLKGDADPGVRRAAAQTLGQLGPAAGGAVPGIAQALQSDDAVEVQSAAALALGQIGPGPAETEPVMAVTALADALTDHHPIVRYQAARALGLLGPAAKDGAPELRAAARAEPDPAFQYQTARALQAIDPESETGDRDALETALAQEVEDLLASLKDSDRERQDEAVLVLGTIGPAAVGAIPEMVQALSTAGFASRGGLERAVRAISSEARTQVAILVEDLQPAQDPEVRARAADELGRIGADAKAAKATLIAGLNDPELADVRFSLADALGEISSYQAEVTRALAAAALRDTSPEVRDNAKESLRETAAQV